MSSAQMPVMPLAAARCSALLPSLSRALMSAPFSMRPCAELLRPVRVARSKGVSPLEVLALMLPPWSTTASTALRSFLFTASSTGCLPQADSSTPNAAMSRQRFWITRSPCCSDSRRRKQAGLDDHARYGMFQLFLEPAAGLEQCGKVDAGVAAHPVQHVDEVF